MLVEECMLPKDRVHLCDSAPMYKCFNPNIHAHGYVDIHACMDMNRSKSKAYIYR